MERSLENTRIAFRVLVAFTVLISLSAHEQGVAFATPIFTASDGISGETIAKLIDQLGSPDFQTRQNAQAMIYADAQGSLDDFNLVRTILQAAGLTSGDPEIVRRSEELLNQLALLGVSITIDDLSDTIKVTADDDKMSFTTQTDPVVEIATIQHPFFSNFVGPTKTVYLIEPGAIPDESGLTPYSDAIVFGVLDGTGLKGLIFNSDGTNEMSAGSINCSLADVVCMPETGKPQDVTKAIFGDKSGFLVLNVISDVEVPEPSTVLLLVTGLLSLVLVRYGSTTTPAARANAFHTWVTWAKEVIQAQSAGKQREQQRDVTPESMLCRDADRDSTSGS
jgi:hypothetical protein